MIKQQFCAVQSERSTGENCSAHVKVLLFCPLIDRLRSVGEASPRQLGAQEVGRHAGIQALPAHDDLVHLRQRPDRIPGERQRLNSQKLRAGNDALPSWQHATPIMTCLSFNWRSL